MLDLMQDGWTQTLIQTGALGLAYLMFRGTQNSHRDTVQDMLREFRQDRNDHNNRTDLLKQAVVEQTNSLNGKFDNLSRDILLALNTVCQRKAEMEGDNGHPDPRKGAAAS